SGFIFHLNKVSLKPAAAHKCGGVDKDAVSNIVAACWFCNQQRLDEKVKPSAGKRQVRTALARSSSLTTIPQLLQK
ncbi:MAG: hypothetical protein RSD57_18730, partial [Comamonas sp.]